MEREGDDKKEEEDKKKKSIAFKASSSSSKNKGKFMKKKGYGARKRRDHTKTKEYARRCYNCKSPDHVVANCPYNSDNDEDENKKLKMDKKEKNDLPKEQERWRLCGHMG